jgi:wyosine [tRNA(Phe)-imidazoG37] synthetase (radical SAM superfamily)
VPLIKALTIFFDKTTMSQKTISGYKHLFGPISSRRLGISLGVDLVPFKTCNLNCVYCECGATTELTDVCKDYAPFEEICSELQQFLSHNPDVDVITLTGSGEPTLHARIGEVISFIRKEFSRYRIAVLTNATRFNNPEVRKRILDADYVLPSIDAISPEVFKKINRPEASLNIHEIIEGVVAFSNEFTGVLWVELFIVPGINDSVEELLHFKHTFERMRITRIQLNSLDRPGTEPWVMPATPERLSEIAAYFSPLPVEIISRSGKSNTGTTIVGSGEKAVIEALKRRPATLEEICQYLKSSESNARILVEKLQNSAVITAEEVSNRIFYRCI